jgi:predicted transcriptional regulator
MEDAVASVDALLRELRAVLVSSRKLPEEDRRVLARTVRQRVANTCAEVDWVLLGRLNRCDKEVFKALRELEGDRGVTFRTTGMEIYERTASTSYSVVYTALRRLDHMGLIERISSQGKAGTLVTINWDTFTVRAPEAA